MPQRIEECFTGNASPEFHSDIQRHYRQIYYEALDFLTRAIQKRFEKPDYQIYVNLENLLLKAANKEDFSEEKNLVTAFYDTDFDAQRLKVHLEIFGEDYTKLITKDLRSIMEHLRDFSEIQKSLISEVTKLVKLILVLPATNATSESAFSMLRLVKSYLRSTMGQSRLNHLMLLSTYKEELDNLNMKELLQYFINKNDYRISMLGHCE